MNSTSTICVGHVASSTGLPRICFIGMCCVLITALLGCAASEMHGFADPDFRGRTFNSVMVSVKEDQLDRRDRAETAFVRTLGKNGLSCKRALDILPPTRTFDEAQFKKALSDAQIDGVLIIRETDYYESETYIPPTSTTNTYGTLSANTYYYRNQANTFGTLNSTAHTTTSGGYTIRKPRVRHESQLWDTKSGKMAWIGGSFTRGNAYARHEHLIEAVASEVRTSLESQGLLPTVAK